MFSQTSSVSSVDQIIRNISNNSNYVTGEVNIDKIRDNILYFNGLKGHSYNNTDSAKYTDIQYAYEIGKNPKIELGGIECEFCVALELRNIDLDILQQSWISLFEMHPMLRAYSLDSGVQKISDFCKDKAYFEWTENNLVDKNQWIIDSLSEIKNASNSNKTKLRVNQFQDGSQILLFYFDLMYVDIRSIWMLLKELSLNYSNEKPNQLNITFFNYLELEKNFKQETQGNLDREYWLSLIDKINTIPDIPLNKQPSQIENVEFVQKSISLKTTDIEQLRKIAGSYGLTAESVILSCYVEVLRRWSKKQSFTIINTNLLRYSFHDDVERLVGNFLKPNLLVIDDQKGKTFLERCHELQKNLIESKIHSSFNGIELLRERLKIKNDKRMFSIPIVFSNGLNSDLKSEVESGIFSESKILFTKTCTPQVWLENQIIAINDIVQINWNYIKELFHEETISEMFKCFVQLIHTLLDSPNEKQIWSQRSIIASLPAKDQLEQDKANSTQINYENTLLIHPILKQARLTPYAIAVEQGNVRYSYSNIINSAYKLAQKIQSQSDIHPNDVIVVSLPQSPELIVAILATLLAGAAYVPLATDIPLERKKNIISRCHTKIVITSDEHLEEYASIEKVESVFLVDISLDDEAVDGEGIINELKQKPDDLAYVIFTSGSTGEPKGVMLSHENALNTVLDINSKFNVSHQDAVLSVAPSNFDLSVYDYFGLLSAGGRIVFLTDPTNVDPRNWWKEVEDKKVTIWNTVPAPFKLLIDQNFEQLHESNLRLVMLSGDWISLDIPETVLNKNKKMQLVSLGGATEGSIWSIYYPINSLNEDWKSVPYGYPLANQKFYVFNDWLERVPKYATGELYIAGTGVAQGYLGDQEKTSKQFFNHPVTNERLYRTGDLGRYMEDGVIEILGREDNQVKINGYRIELGEIESCLLRFKEINHVVLDSVEHKDSKQKQLVAYYIKNEDVDISNIELKEFLSDLLPSYMIPTYFIEVDSIPLTPNGKVNKKALPKPWEIQQQQICEKENLEFSSFEKNLQDLLSEEIKHRNFTLSQGFFDLGGDSLHAIGFISSIKSKFDIDEDTEQSILEHLFMNGNIKELAKLLETSAVGV